MYLMYVQFSSTRASSPALVESSPRQISTLGRSGRSVPRQARQVKSRSNRYTVDLVLFVTLAGKPYLPGSRLGQVLDTNQVSVNILAFRLGTLQSTCKNNYEHTSYKPKVCFLYSG